jgi:hypothetical protein
MQAHLQKSYPTARFPSFRVSEDEDDVLYAQLSLPVTLRSGSWHYLGPAARCICRYLHYWSYRNGLYPIVQGLVQELAKVFFETTIRLEVHGQPEVNKVGGDRVLFRINCDGGSSSDREAGGSRRLVGVNTKQQRQSLTALAALNDRLPERLLSQFPWHMVVSSEMSIVHCGDSMLRRFGKRIAPADGFVSFEESCKMIRPVFDDTTVLTYDDLLQHTRVPFIISVFGELPIQGQMVPLQTALIFLASPHANSLDELTSLSLTMSDLPLHDSRREMILATETRNAELELTKSLDEGKGSHDGLG